VSSTSWEQDRKRLERELRSEPYPSLLQNLKRQNPSFREFDSWDEIIVIMRATSVKDPRTDEILKPIFGAYRDGRDPGWRTILLALFWRELERIHGFKSHWDADPEALWANTTWAFLETIDRINLQTRPDRLGQKIFNDTIHRLHDGYRREWDWENSIVDPSDWENEDDDEGKAGNRLETLMGGREAVEFGDVELRHDQEVEIKCLRAYVSRGLISEPDFFLIVGTRIYGASLSDYVEDQGLDYESAKKRRQRAEATIRRLERKQKNL
jgi:hypothetical protein